jgi:hypothetical protein
MGRHAAPGDDEDDAAAAPALDESAAVVTGRHAVVEDPREWASLPVEESHVSLSEVAADDRPLGLIAEHMSEEVPPRTHRGNQSTAADLALLREHSDVRARVVAALVVPFVLYTAVLFLIGRLGVYLIWVWIPLVSAGVVAGSILDAEHRRRARPAGR